MAHPNRNPAQPRTYHPFYTTHWTAVLEANEKDSAVATAALEELCHVYWYPIYSEIRRRGHPPHDAQDLTQEFFACLLRRSSFKSVRQERGRFRSFLLGALDYFLSDQKASRNAAKRGGGCPLLSLDELAAEDRYGAEPATSETPEQIFDRRWTVALMEQAFAELAREYERAGKSTLFSELKQYLAMESSEGGYAASADRLGMTPAAVAVATHRLRERYRAAIREEVMNTLANPADADDELRCLLGS